MWWQVLRLGLFSRRWWRRRGKAGCYLGWQILLSWLGSGQVGVAWLRWWQILRLGRGQVLWLRRGQILRLWWCRCCIVVASRLLLVQSFEVQIEVKTRRLMARMRVLMMRVRVLVMVMRIVMRVMMRVVMRIVVRIMMRVVV